MQVYIFHRGDMWYPIELKDDKEAVDGAIRNPGTTKVTNAKTKKVVWELKEVQNKS